MRKLMVGMLLAAGTALPAIAANAQDRPPEAQHHEHGGGQPHQAPAHDQARPQPQQRPQSAPPHQAPQAQPQAQAQVQMRAQAHVGGPGGYRGDGGGRFNGDPHRFDQGNRPPPPQQQQQGYRAQGGPGVPPGPGNYRPQGGPAVAGGYRAQGGPPVAPGSGGYRAQGGPGYGGYRPQGGPGARPAPPPPGPNGSWNRGWRGNGQFNYVQYRVQNNYIFRLPHYYAPAGWGYGYRRFSPGISLSAVLFAQNYWIDDPFYYRLPPAYGPYRWVRYYNDALLIDIRSGYVVDVVHDIFW